MARFAIRNIGSKRTMMPGGWLPPGGVVVLELSDHLHRQFDALDHLELSPSVAKKKKATKKKAKKQET
jgi:hypothetical protein